MAERCVKGDYIGFTFGGVHSSELGLMRVSNGSRYEQDLLPPLQDKTAQVSGRDGVVYFNSQYNTKPIKVPVAFDNMTEESFQKLKELVMDKKPKYLWFDETPYKQWLVKAGGLQSFKWVCFDESKNIDRLDDEDSEGTKKRIYKGEGTLEFVCFTPYAESRILFLDEPVDYVWDWNRAETPKRLVQYFKDNEIYLERKRKELGKELPVLTLECNYNFDEWKESSNLRNNIEPDIYNAGDIPTNTFISFTSQLKEKTTISLYSSFDLTNEVAKIVLKPFELKGDDVGFIIDSKLKTIKGFKMSEDGQSKIITNNIYSKYHIGGDYFKIPVCADNEYYIIKSTSENEFTVDYKHYYI